MVCSAPLITGRAKSRLEEGCPPGVGYLDYHRLSRVLCACAGYQLRVAAGPLAGRQAGKARNQRVGW